MPYTTGVAADFETDPFPSFDDGLDAVVLDDDLEDDIAQYVAAAFGVAWEFDFEAGDLFLTNQGRASLVEGVDALRQWCRHILLTQRGESPVLNDDIGTTLEGLLGGRTTDPYVLARIKQEVVGALEMHDRIQEVVVDSVIPSGSNVYVFVTIKLDTGEEIEDAIGL